MTNESSLSGCTSLRLVSGTVTLEGNDVTHINCLYS